MQEVNSQLDMYMVRVAYQWFLDKLKIREHDDLMDVKLANIGKLKGSFGVCTASYNIESNNLDSITIKIGHYPSGQGMVEVLAHEMIHAKQHLDGRFLYVRTIERVLGVFPKLVHKTYFDGEDMTGIEYSKLPYEVEAFTEQKSYSKEFLAWFYKNLTQERFINGELFKMEDIDGLQDRDRDVQEQSDTQDT